MTEYLDKDKLDAKFEKCKVEIPQKSEIVLDINLPKESETKFEAICG